MLKILALSLLFGTLGNLLIDGPRDVARRAQNARALLVAYSLRLRRFALRSVMPSGFLVIKETDVNVTALTIFVQPLAGLLIMRRLASRTPALGPILGQGWRVIVGGLVLGLSRQIEAVPAIEGLNREVGKPRMDTDRHGWK